MLAAVDPVDLVVGGHHGPDVGLLYGGLEGDEVDLPKGGSSTWALIVIRSCSWSLQA